VSCKLNMEILNRTFKYHDRGGILYNHVHVVTLEIFEGLNYVELRFALAGSGMMVSVIGYFKYMYQLVSVCMCVYVYVLYMCVCTCTCTCMCMCTCTMYMYITWVYL
jgi:hypothetical protein